MAEAKNKKRFFKDFKSELKKVIWPTAKQTAKNTAAVLFLVFLVSLTVVVLDFGFRKGYDFVVDKVTGGTISQSKDIFKEMENYTDENTINMYRQFYSAGYINLEGLQAALEELKNPTTENQTEGNVTEEQTQQGDSQTQVQEN